MRKAAFAPVIDADTRVLILGSLPGEASLAAERYYAHPQNRFWHLVGAIINREDLPALGYEQRLDALRAASVGLWDTIASAVRTGSLDTAIRLAEPAPLAALAASLPRLAAIGFNGATAARLGRRALAGTPVMARGVALVDLPSSSPAYAAMSPSDKRVRWLALRAFLPDGSPDACAGAAARA
jgi:hypoxanthine-DNA glycosylase